MKAQPQAPQPRAVRCGASFLAVGVAVATLGDVSASEQSALSQDGVPFASLVPASAAPDPCDGPRLEVFGDRISPRVRTLPEGAEAPFERNRLEFQGERVRYEAVSLGEFGGKITAVLPNGERRVIIEDHARALIPSGLYGKRLHVFAGLSHLGIADGAVYAIDDYDSEPRVSRITLLPDTPQLVVRHAAHPHWDRFWIIGHTAIMELIDERTLRVHTINTFRFRQVTSALEGDRTLMLGLCGAVAVIDGLGFERSMPGRRPSIAYFVLPNERR